MKSLKDKIDVIIHALTQRYDVRRIQEELFNKYLSPEIAVYDVGCGDKPFKKFFLSRGQRYIGIDIENGFYHPDNTDLIGSAESIPLPDASIDAMISCQVIEHVENPVRAIEEVGRTLKPGGLLFLSFPFMYPMHAVPHDYTRFTEYAMSSVLAENGIEIVDLRRIGGFWYCAALFLTIYLQVFDRGLIKKTQIVRLLVWLLRLLFGAIHTLESAIVKLSGRDIETFRRIWTVNYVLVARKKLS